MSQTSIPDAASPSPEQRDLIDRRIEQTRRHVKLIDIASSLAVLASAILAYLLALAVIDHWVVGLSPLARMIALILMLLSTGWYLVVRVLPPLLRPVNPVFAAHAIEQAAPSLKNSLINVLLLRRRKQQVRPLIFDGLRRQAEVQLSAVPTEAMVDRAPLIHAGYLLVALMALAAAYKILSPKDPLSTAARVAAPWQAIDRPSRVRILEVTPGDAEVHRGQALEIDTRVEGLRDDEAVVLYYTTDDRQFVDRPIEFERLTSTQFRVALGDSNGGLRQSQNYFVTAGDARSDDYRIVVTDAPHIAVEAIEYQYPAYTKLRPKKVEGQADISAVEGTRVRIIARANQSIAKATLELFATGDRDNPSQSRPLPMKHQGDQAIGGLTLLLKPDRQTPLSSAYQLRFTTHDGVRNQRPARYPIDVIRDLAPEVEILQPLARQVDVAENGQLEIEIRAFDPDFSVQQIRVLGAIGGEQRLQQALLEQPESGQVIRKYTLRPSRLKLVAGDQLLFWAEVEDSRHDAKGRHSPNTSRSSNYQIRVVPASSTPSESASDEDSESGEGQESDAGDEGESETAEGGASSESTESGATEESSEAGEGEAGEGEGGEGQEGEGGSESQEGANDGGSEAASTSEGEGGGESSPGESTEQNGSGAANDSKPTGDPSQGGGGDNQESDGDEEGDGGAESSEPVPSDGSNDAEAFERVLKHQREREQQQNQESAGGEGQETDDSNAEGGESAEESGSEDGEGPSTDESDGSSGGTTSNEDSQTGGGENSSGTPANDDSAAAENQEGEPQSGRGAEAGESGSKPNEDADSASAGGSSDSQEEPAPDGTQPGEGQGGRPSDDSSQPSESESPSGAADDPSAKGRAGRQDPSNESDASRQTEDPANADSGGNAQANERSPGREAPENAAGSSDADASDTPADAPQGDRREGKAVENGQPSDGNNTEQSAGGGAANDDTASENEGQPSPAGGGANPGDRELAASGDSGSGQEDPNLEYSKKATDLALEYLKEHGDDKELLDRLGWNREEMEAFVRRWEQLRRQTTLPGDRGRKAKGRLADQLRGLGLKPPNAQSRRTPTANRTLQRRLQNGAEAAIPPEYADQFRAYLKSVPEEK